MFNFNCNKKSRDDYETMSERKLLHVRLTARFRPQCNGAINQVIEQRVCVLAQR